MSLFTQSPILAQVQDALPQLNQDKPIGVYDVPDTNASLMGSLANMIGPLMMTYPWQQFRKTYTVTGDGVASSFALPPDMSRIIDNTGWSHASRRPVIVVVASTWAEIKAWLGQSFFVNPAVRIFEEKMFFLTPPALDEIVDFEYVDKNWVVEENGVVLKERLEKNSDVPRFDSLLFTLALKLKWAGVRGMPTQEYQQDFNERWTQITNYNQIGGTLSLNGGLGGWRYLNGYNMPNTGYGSNVL